MQSRTLRVCGALLLAACSLAGCGGGGGPPRAVDVAVEIERAWPALEFDAPVAFVQAPDDSTRWFVVEQGGVVRSFASDPGAASSAVVLNISALVADASGERGLFGIAFHPEFDTNGHAFVHYTRADPSLTSYVSRFTSADGGETLDPDSETVLLTLEQPFSNHNGGQIAFGPDGLLYVAFGDGGSGNDPGNRAQDTTNLFGTIVRLAVDALPYTVPAGNPFAGNPRCVTGSGTLDCPEIWAWGLRNPWRFSFDRQTGALWAGDVGQGAWEEVDIIEGGRNYGWRIREGAHCNIPDTGCPTAGLTDPVAEYGHDVGQSITGGYVYRGRSIPALAGSYVFGDYVTGRVFRVELAGGAVEELLDTTHNISTFGESLDGELYLVDRVDGQIWRLIEAP